MIKAIIFDLDGVIIESAEIKTDAFRMLFADYPDRLPEIIAYHQRNAGISRYNKFRYIYEKMLGQELSLEKEKELGDRFSQIVLDEVIKAPLVAGAEDFLKSNYQRYILFVISGTPEEELHYILRRRGLDIYFQGAYGTPRTKPEITRRILAEHQLASQEVVSVGDAESDRISAEKVGIFFIARISSDNYELRGCRWQVKDLTELDAVLSRLSSRQEKGG
jgi:HAD superfamily hydrolase (TIGR01549 family)